MVVNEINTVSESEANIDSSAANLGNHLNSHRDDILDIKFTIKWVKLTIVMAFTALFALLSVSYIRNNGKLHPKTILRQNPFSFLMFLMVLMIAFFFAVNGVIFSGKHPIISRAFSLVALIGGILSFTVLLWAFLPPEFSWAPWIFFAFTFGSLLYLCGLHRQRNLKGPDDLCNIHSSR